MKFCSLPAIDDPGLKSFINGTTTGEQFRYTGRRYDAETGLYYYRARYYSPQMGRFLQTDPIGYKDDINLYTYVGNDPTDKVDPTGTQEEGQLAELPLIIDEVATIIEEVEGAAVEGGQVASRTAQISQARDIGAAAIQNSDKTTPAKPSAPPGNGGTTKTPHGSDEHNAKVDKVIQKMRDDAYGDIRKDQAQVDANGNKVGNNRPDAQGTNPATGQREHVEVDRDPRRGDQHEQDIKRNDPNSKCTKLPCP